MQSASHLTWQSSTLNRQERAMRNGHQSCTLWFTGLSGAGKSTLAFALEQELFARGKAVYVLDGDNIRHGLNRDLGFSPEDRRENIRRIGEVSKLLVDAGIIVLSAFISPHEEDREMVRNFFAPEDFVEVYVKCSLAECERRDPKGLYKKARSGQIPNFTGVSAGYDIPRSPALVMDTEELSVEESVKLLIEYLEGQGLLNFQA
ncbi:adenylyl-sulfate kinase [Paenibacillus sp. GCM10012307]|uniref:Adenylyl-sulfate kinase n=1 Tax=Paenibacillus roseus TaxID=2798579 RepID=A0A934MMS1_9BACL|nr:adenylyl-sulfate kinase [Paenibacillus roseus]MBJ6360236.1 adenylyl-sulfate kinase [Paenibacillus roseus]